MRKIDGEEILARIESEGVTLLCGAPAVVAAVLAAAAARRERGQEVPGRGHGAHGRGRRPPALEDHRSGRDRARVGVHPDLRAHRDHPAAHHQPGPVGVGRPRRRRARRQAWPGPGSPPSGCASASTRTARSWPAPTTCSTGTGSSPRTRPAALEGGWFHTGDGGYLDGPYTVIADRKKDVIITGGENVSSIEVEDCLYQHPAVAEAAVIGVPDDKWGETVKALVVLRPGAVATEEELIDFCRARLAHFKAPTSVELRDGLTRTATGKLQKYKLRQPYWEGHDRQVN